MAALAVDILAAPPDFGRGLAAVPIAMAALYTPSIWASVARTGSRQAILRASVAALAMTFAGGIFFVVFFLVVLLPAATLLCLPSGGPRPPRWHGRTGEAKRRWKPCGSSRMKSRSP